MNLIDIRSALTKVSQYNVNIDDKRSVNVLSSYIKIYNKKRGVFI